MKSILKKTMKDSKIVVENYNSMHREFKHEVVLQIMPVNNEIFIAEIIDKEAYKDICKDLLED